MPNTIQDDDNVNKNAPYRANRRAARQATTKRGSRGRRITVHSELREQPDVRKIARAIIAMALADAEREAQAEAAHRAPVDRGDGDAQSPLEPVDE